MRIYSPTASVAARVSRELRQFQNRRLLNFTLERPMVSVSFDDFPASAITEGATGLEARGWRGTYYTCANLAGTTNHHGLHFAPQDLVALEARGHEIAGHTLDHVDLNQISAQQTEQQCKDNIIALRALGVKGPLTGFAYPFGEASTALKAQLGRSHGAIRGIRDGAHYGKADLNELKACGVYSSTLDTILARIRGLKSRPAWLILFTHDITYSPSEWGCTPDEYSRVLDALCELDCDVLPVGDAAATLEQSHA